MKPDTERKRYFQDPIHLRRKRMHVHLSPELRKVCGKRAILIRSGDKVKIMRGQYKGQERIVARVDYKYYRVYLQGLSRKNARGEERLIPFHPSNLMLVSPVMTEERKKKYPGLFVGAKAPAQAEGKAAVGKEEEKQEEKKGE